MIMMKRVPTYIHCQFQNVMDTGTISESEWMVFQEVETIKQILGRATSTEISLKLKGIHWFVFFFVCLFGLPIGMSALLLH